MKHLGDIKAIHGGEIEPVDCIIGGSPCQDYAERENAPDNPAHAPACSRSKSES